MNIVTNIDKIFKDLISKAVEINIATAMITEYGVNLLSKAKKNTVVKLVVGIDLPTPIDVLRTLHNTYKDNARVYLASKYTFHPKVYAFKMKDGSKNAIVGSGNYTQGGFHDNIELSYWTSEKNDCEAIFEWFDKIYTDASPITNSFLNKYKNYSDHWKSQRDVRKSELKEIIEEQQEIQADNDRLVKEIKKQMTYKQCQQWIAGRKAEVDKLKDALDYYNDFKGIDAFAFAYENKELGWINPVNKRNWERSQNDGSLRKLAKMLCDETIPIETRMRRALDPNDMKLEGINHNFITKILVAHNPKKYILWNAVLDTFMKEFHFEFERGTKDWQKYPLLCQHFKKVITEVGLNNFAELDAVLLSAIRRIKSLRV